MADDFSFLTDSDDERAVEDILSQAKDHSVLEQIAAINCSSFSTSDNLPSDLENRFRKLKSLPTTATAGSRFPPSRSKSFTPQSGNDSCLNQRHPPSSNSVDSEEISDLKTREKKSNSEEDSDGNRDENNRRNLRSKQKSETNTNSVDFEQIPSPSTGNPEEYSDGNRDEKKRANSRSKPKRPGTGSSGSWSLSSPESESRSVSPARRGFGCLWCSPKKEKRKQGKENRLSGSSSPWGNDYDVEFLKTFSMKEQKKIMKQAMKEEEKINREAEKIVKWAKQASARMIDVSGLDDDELDDTK